MNYGEGRNQTLATFIILVAIASSTIMVRTILVSLIQEATKVFFWAMHQSTVLFEFSIKEP